MADTLAPPPVVSLADELDRRAAKLREELAGVEAQQLRLRGLSAGTSAALEAPEVSEPSLWLSFRELFNSALALGEQYPTGLPTVDRCTDGGLAKATVTVIQGKPGAGKTLLAQQIALHLAPRCAVAGLFQDEGLAGARIRLGQQLGLDRRAMRRPSAESSDEAVAALEARAVFWRFLQPRSEKSTVELFAAEFDAMAPPDLPRVWILDSAQVLRSEKVASKDKRIAVSELIWRIRELADRYKAIALLVSQVNRGSYRSKKEEEHVSDLAAGLESSAIEYASELILHIDGDPKTIVKIRCPKNRYTGDLFSLACGVDFPTATFRELASQADTDGIPNVRAETQADRDARTKLDADLFAFLEARWLEGERLNQSAVLIGFRAARQLAGLPGDKETNVSTSLARLAQSGKVAAMPGKRGAIYYERPAPKTEVPPDASGD